MTSQENSGNSNNLLMGLKNTFNHYSVKELTSLAVKMAAVGFLLMLVTYAIENRVVASYQNFFITKIMPITALQRDVGGNLVDYALLEEKIYRTRVAEGFKDLIYQQANTTNGNLAALHDLVKEDETLLKVKEVIDSSHILLAEGLLNIEWLRVVDGQVDKNLATFKEETKTDLQKMIVLREKMSGKIALIDAKSRRSNIRGNDYLVRADLLLGIKMADLANNVSTLMYVDNDDELNDINKNQLLQNLSQVRTALVTIQNTTKPMKSLFELYEIAIQMSSKLDSVQLRIVGSGSLIPVLKEKFAIATKLQQASIDLKKILSNIESNLKKMSLLTNERVAEAVKKSEKVSLVGSIIIVALSVLFMFLLVALLTAIARQINKPIEFLNDTMGRLTHGDLSARLPVGESISDEFSTLWSDFNTYAEKNERTIKELEIIFDNADIGIAWVNNRHYSKMNEKLLSILGYTEEEMDGRSTRNSYKNSETYDAVGRAYDAMSSDNIYVGEHELVRADGSRFWCKMTCKSTGSSDKSDTIWLYEDISERKLADEKLYQLANFDSLTNLPNRDLFNIYLDAAIVKAKRRKTSFVVLFVDLDRFKHINDSLGHEAGDMVLKEVSLRMRSVIRESDTLARLGGDEFTIILDDVTDVNDIEKVASNLLAVLARVMKYKEKEIFAGGSIGISRYPEDSVLRSDLLSCADSAMYQAKQTGRNKYSFYSASLGEQIEEFTSLSQDLKKALEHNEFELHYQPKVDMKTREILGAEALIRWNKPGEGIITPFKFIPVLEESGLMVQVGEWVIFEACRAIKTWESLGYNTGKIAINLSERQFGDNSLLDSIARALEETSVCPSKIELEITESLMMDDSDSTMAILNGIKELGIDIAMDDFGTGYSSLAYLKRFPIDILKIDRAFVKDITVDPDDAVIVEAIIAMAKQLNLKTVAEGIETEEQYAFLSERGCEIGQGYLFSKPVPFDKMMELYASGSKLEIILND